MNHCYEGTVNIINQLYDFSIISSPWKLAFSAKNTKGPLKLTLSVEQIAHITNHCANILRRSSLWRLELAESQVCICQLLSRVKRRLFMVNRRSGGLDRRLTTQIVVLLREDPYRENRGVGLTSYCFCASAMVCFSLFVGFL